MSDPTQYYAEQAQHLLRHLNSDTPSRAAEAARRVRKQIAGLATRDADRLPETVNHTTALDVIAREQGYAGWTDLKRAFETGTHPDPAERCGCDILHGRVRLHGPDANDERLREIASNLAPDIAILGHRIRHVDRDAPDELPVEGTISCRVTITVDGRMPDAAAFGARPIRLTPNADLVFSGRASLPDRPVRTDLSDTATDPSSVWQDSDPATLAKRAVEDDLMDLMLDLRSRLRQAGLQTTQVEDWADADYVWDFEARRPGAGDEESVGVRLTLMDGAEGDGGEGVVGLHLGVDGWGGRVLGALAPYNYTEHFWIDHDDTEAIRERIGEMQSGLDAVFDEIVAYTESLDATPTAGRLLCADCGWSGPAGTAVADEGEEETFYSCPQCSAPITDLEDAVQARGRRLSDAALESLWAELGDVAIDEDEAIDEDWRDWPEGTHREDIWHWFDEHHSKGVVWLMHGIEPKA